MCFIPLFLFEGSKSTCNKDTTENTRISNDHSLAIWYLYSWKAK